MHDEFIMRHERPVLAHFGLNALVCCGPMHEKLPYARKIPNLRRVRIHRWTRNAKELALHYS